MAPISVNDPLDDLIARFGEPHEWDAYHWFINKWRLIAGAVEIRAIIDVALHCPNKKLAALARRKFGVDFDVAQLDATWPGRAAFTYDWKGLGVRFRHVKARAQARKKKA